MGAIRILQPLEQPLTIPIPAPRSKRRYRLIKTWSCQFVDEKGVSWKIKLAENYECDGASVPRLLWTFSDLTPDGLIRQAALPHDFIYEHKGRMPIGSTYKLIAGLWQPHYLELSRKEADKLFYEFAKEAGVNKTSRKRAYWAVRLFGWLAWNT